MSENNKNRQGLTTAEAKTKNQTYGLNVLKKTKKPNVFLVFLSQFKDAMVILLLIAAVVSLGIAIYNVSKNYVITREQNEVVALFISPFVIFLVVFLNSLIGTYQSLKSYKAVKSLEKNNELKAKVYRDGKIQVIPSSEVTVGDFLIVEAGDYISADAKILKCYDFSVVESSLTGESNSVFKRVGKLASENIPLGDRFNQIFSGTYVSKGRALAEVYAIGENTQLGKISQMIKNQKELLTPLQKKLIHLSKIFGYAGVALFLLTAILHVLLSALFSNDSLGFKNPKIYSDAFLIGISLAVAAVPEGLVTFSTVLLAIGVSRVTKNKAIIRNLPSIEVLGSTTVICSDKTGTMTQNKMQVVGFYDFANPAATADKSMVGVGFFATNTATIRQEGDKLVEIGDPTEIGILKYLTNHKLSQEMFWRSYSKLSTLEFDSERKMMSVLLQTPRGRSLIVKGAPDVILKRSLNANRSHYEKIEEFISKGYRVLALAYKKWENPSTQLSVQDENNLTFLGLVALYDPPREEVASSILSAKNAGVKTIMITGDHIGTAVSIAKNLGIYQTGDLAVSGAELASWDDKYLDSVINNVSVFARVNPSDKLRIVSSLQRQNQVVAMTGDGINDAPALKKANIGIAMGQAGTDVAKEASGVVLADDNYKTIVNSIRIGRETFDRIKLVITNLLVSSIAEVIIILLGLFIYRFAFNRQIDGNEFIILSATQLLIVNLLAHGLPAIALGIVKQEENVMLRKPYKTTDTIFSNGTFIVLLRQSLIIAFYSLLAYGVVGLFAIINDLKGKEFVRLCSSAAFLTLGISSSLNTLNLMTKKNLVFANFNRYKWAILASLSSFLIVVFLGFTPYLSEWIGNANVLSENYTALYGLIPLIFGFIPLFWEEIHKLFDQWWKDPSIARPDFKKFKLAKKK